jgi:tRNA G18 (ribose-2'-O)-methylase SpoU
LCGITAIPPNKEIHKTALGATETVLWEHHNSTLECIKELKNKNLKVFCIEQNNKSILLNHFEPDSAYPIALVFGNEVSGVNEQVMELCENCIEIPQFGTKHSLNVSVAGGIALWDIFNKMNRI